MSISIRLADTQLRLQGGRKGACTCVIDEEIEISLHAWHEAVLQSVKKHTSGLHATLLHPAQKSNPSKVYLKLFYVFNSSTDSADTLKCQLTITSLKSEVGGYNSICVLCFGICPTVAIRLLHMSTYAVQIFVEGKYDIPPEF